MTAALLAHLTTVDYAHRFAVVAGDATGHGIAIARYEPAHKGSADVAVAVDPAWRRVGLADAAGRTMISQGIAEAMVALDQTTAARTRRIPHDPT